MYSGLETTATYDKTTQEFIMHSPTLTALKWWPGKLSFDNYFSVFDVVTLTGTLGKSSTHSVVVARLFIDGALFGINSVYVI